MAQRVVVLSAMPQVMATEEEAASIVASIDIPTAHMSQTSVDLVVACRLIANGWDTISNVPLPIFVISNCPAHF